MCISWKIKCFISHILQFSISYNTKSYVYVCIYTANRDFSKTQEMLTALNSGASVRVTKPLVETNVESLDRSHITLFGCGLDKKEQNQLMTLTQQLKLKMTQSYS